MLRRSGVGCGDRAWYPERRGSVSAAGACRVHRDMGPNVVVTGAGTLDLSGLTLGVTTSATSGMIPGLGVLGVGAASADAVEFLTGLPAQAASDKGDFPSK
jgi:hypothetical protein